MAEDQTDDGSSRRFPQVAQPMQQGSSQLGQRLEQPLLQASQQLGSPGPTHGGECQA